ncbi:MAG TPA: hypothetical protein VGA08_03465 [Candidatus Saccharimonadales bacterium]
MIGSDFETSDELDGIRASVAVGEFPVLGVLADWIDYLEALREERIDEYGWGGHGLNIEDEIAAKLSYLDYLRQLHN